MIQINFKNLIVYSGVAHKNQVTADARESFADLIYTRVDGIVAHDLAFRIYRSEGDISISEQEKNIIIRAAEQFCVPAIIDAIKEQLKNN